MRHRVPRKMTHAARVHHQLRETEEVIRIAMELEPTKKHADTLHAMLKDVHRIRRKVAP